MNTLHSSENVQKKCNLNPICIYKLLHFMNTHNISKEKSYLLCSYSSESFFSHESKRVGQDQVLQCEAERLVTLWV